MASPLIRALETAQIIADEADYPIDRIITNGLLMERSYGSFAGQPFSAERDPVRFPDIESDEQLTARVQAAYDFLCDLAAENVLVVGHGDYAMILQHLISPEAPVEELPNAEIVQLM